MIDAAKQSADRKRRLVMVKLRLLVPMTLLLALMMSQTGPEEQPSAIPMIRA